MIGGCVGNNCGKGLVNGYGKFYAESMPVLNVRELSAAQIRQLASTFAAIAEKELLPVGQLDKDPVRIQIDDAIAKVLELPNLAPIRELLAREPGLTALEINPTYTQGDLALDEEESAQEVLF